MQSKKKILGHIIKWGIILGFLAFGCVRNRVFMREAINEIMNTPGWIVLICFILGNLYFIAEGTIISSMTKSCEEKLSIWQGIFCTYMCAFYRLATLGSGNGIAQVYYYNVKGIDISRGLGMSITQYTFQKITIGIFGVAAYLLLVITGDSAILEYKMYMLLGVIVISIICIALFLITISKKISDFAMMILRKLIKEKSRFYHLVGKAQNSIDCMQEQSSIVWHDRMLFIKVLVLNVVKLSAWYMIPGVYFKENFNVNLLVCLALMAVTNMLGCVMLAPSGVGTLDFVFAILFATLISENDSIAAGLVMYRFFTWVVPFIIGLIPALLVRKKKKENE